MNKKKIVKIVIGILCLIVVLVCVFLICGAVDYVNSVPEITPKENVSVASGSTIRPRDVADITDNAEVIRFTRAHWKDNESPSGLEVTNDAIIITEGTGILVIGIYAVGDVAEPVTEYVEIEVE